MCIRDSFDLSVCLGSVRSFGSFIRFVALGSLIRHARAGRFSVRLLGSVANSFVFRFSCVRFVYWVPVLNYFVQLVRALFSVRLVYAIYYFLFACAVRVFGSLFFSLFRFACPVSFSVRLVGSSGCASALKILEFVYSVRLFGSLIRFAYSVRSFGSNGSEAELKILEFVCSVCLFSLSVRFQ